MSSSVAAHITVGGKLKDSQVEKFIGSLDGFAPELDMEIEINNRNELNRVIHRCITRGFPFRLAHNETDGTCSDLEDFCEANDLTYIRWNGQSYDIDSNLKWWSPGMKHPMIVASDTGAKSLVPLSTLTWWDGTVTELAAKYTPPVIPPFEIVP